MITKEDEAIIRKFVISVVQEGQSKLARSDELPFQLIKHLRCTKPEADDIIKKMEFLGLGCCSDQYYTRLGDFAIMRGYSTVEEIERIENAFRYKPKPRGIKRR
jgi:hypothetical protein